MKFQEQPSISTIAEDNHNSSKKRIVKKQITKPPITKFRRLALNNFQKKKVFGKMLKRNIIINKLSQCLSPQQYSCTICLDLMVMPTTLVCGHSFCLACVQKLSNSSLNCVCSLCRSTTITPLYQANKNLGLVMDMIQEFRLDSRERQEYLQRKWEILRQQLKQRGTSEQLKANEQIRIRICGSWKRAKVISIMQKKNRIFYQLQVLTTDQLFVVANHSINIRKLNEQQVATSKQQKGQYFSTDIFLEEQYPVRTSHINNTYNIQDLLLQVNYYPEEDRSIYRSDSLISYQELAIPEESQHSQALNIPADLIIE